MQDQYWSLKWNDDLCFGAPEIDREHQHFIDLVDDLNHAIVDRMDLSEIRKRLQLILDHERNEFAHEEELFVKCNYPDAAHHAREHQNRFIQINEIMNGLNENSSLYKWIEGSLKVKEKLIWHFLIEDIKFRDYFLSISP